MIEIVHEDLVDWEPLVMRFCGPRKMGRPRAQSLARFVGEWFDQAAAADPEVWQSAKEWRAEIGIDGVVVARCEFMPPEAIPLLADAVGKRFRSVTQLRVGYPLKGPVAAAGFDWIHLEGGRVRVDGKAVELDGFTISFSAVTIAQFEGFIKATGYQPVPDKTEYHDTLENARGTYGSKKAPMFGVTHDDATAYCEWARLRLPTESELAHFFDHSVRSGRKFNWGFPCWSSTRVSTDTYVARNGPYVRKLLDDYARHRIELHRHHYDWPYPPCFRVVKIVW